MNYRLDNNNVDGQREKEERHQSECRPASAINTLFINIFVITSRLDGECKPGETWLIHASHLVDLVCLSFSVIQ